ncbi:hypothetical protein CTAYLR_004648 [Chrysophaeum taylorii]|uniref:Guanylyl cyclase n=1 Tax=Chrysophaeum taylorii TaxID=2483200 RepID=A0AAD7XIE1_9STRA|nr:hypothetical protein CTAYLR_003746 [Chrysophaeum taylorii]KAJ8614117.1 hypothetical protein CTAYLR_004648 [Chrysophaeum taylorii]
MEMLTMDETRETWDCGIACLQMVTGASWEEVLGRCGTRSIWTVDLAQVLHGLEVRFVFATKTLGCDPAYKRLPFYSNDISTDEDRIRRIFSRAEFKIHQKIVSSELLEAILAAGYAVVVLVDLRFLNGEVPSWTYTGHYVVLFAVERGYVAYRDPAADQPELWVKSDDLHKARTAHGTDEDLVVVRLP